MSMTLCMPKSWFKQMEILSSFTGGKEIEKVFKNINFVRPEKTEVKVEEINTEEVKIEESKVEEAKTENSKTEEVKVEESSVMLNPVDITTGDNITMGTRRTCPVKVMPKKKGTYKVQIGTTPKKDEVKVEEKFDESLEAFKAKLVEKSIKVLNINRVNTGLLEVSILNNFNQPVLMTVDNDDLLYGLGADVFFIGSINPLDEYTKQGLILTDESLNAVLNNQPIDPKFYVPSNIITMATMLDTASIHEHNTKKKKAVLEKAVKAILEVEPNIRETMGSEPFRFSFVRYKSIDDFTIVSDKKSKVSNLHEQKLLASRSIRIDVKNKNVNMVIK